MPPFGGAPSRLPNIRGPSGDALLEGGRECDNGPTYTMEIHYCFIIDILFGVLFYKDLKKIQGSLRVFNDFFFNLIVE